MRVASDLMPDPSKYDLDYGPVSYWGPQNLTTHYGSRIKGELRRSVALGELDRGFADEEVLKPALSDDERTAAGAFHPGFMGGEYLPDLISNEVEIARVILKSTTMDVVSIYARRTKRRIIYRIVDEYPEDETEYTIRPKTSTNPLTLRRLIAMIDGAVENGLVGNSRIWFYHEGESTPEEIYDFETAYSAFYPQLAGWYDEDNQEWLDRVTRELEEAERAEEEEEKRKANDPHFMKLSDWVKRAEYTQSSEERPSALSGMARAMKWKTIEAYVTDYYEKFSCLPTGIHSIPRYGSMNLGSMTLGDINGEVEVRFPENEL